MTMRIAVVYDYGAVAPAEIVDSLRGVAEPLFVLPHNDHTLRLRPILERLGECLWLEDGGPADVQRVCESRVDGAVTFSDAWLEFTAVTTAALGSAGHDMSTTRRLTDKLEQRRALGRAGVESIRFAEFSDAREWRSVVEQVGLPLVLKPRRGVASRDTYLVTDPQAGATLASSLRSDEARGGSFIAEEFLAGPDMGPFGDFVSVESAVYDGLPHHIAVTGKFPLAPPFRETGHFWPTVLGEEMSEQVIALTDASFRALGVRFGILHTEIKLCPDGPRVIEVNGRLGGRIQALSRVAGGPDLIAVAARIALGEEPQLPALSHEAVVFAAITPAPVDACTITSLPERQAVLALPGVEEYAQFARVGDYRAAGVSTTALDQAVGRVRDHEVLVETIARLRSHTQYGLEFEAGARVLAGRELVCGEQGTQITVPE